MRRTWESFKSPKLFYDENKIVFSRYWKIKVIKTTYKNLLIWGFSQTNAEILQAFELNNDFIIKILSSLDQILQKLLCKWDFFFSHSRFLAQFRLKKTWKFGFSLTLLKVPWRNRAIEPGVNGIQPNHLIGSSGFLSQGFTVLLKNYLISQLCSETCKNFYTFWKFLIFQKFEKIVSITTDKYK